MACAIGPASAESKLLASYRLVKDAARPKSPDAGRHVAGLVHEGQGEENRRETRYALVIGNSAYSGVMKLRNAAADAVAVAAALKSAGFEVDLSVDATEAQFRDAVDNLERKALETDIVLVYYAGHGLQSKRKNYLLPVDNYPRDVIDVRRHGVTLDKVVEAASPARKGHVVVLDTCFRQAGPRPGVPGSDADGLAAISGEEGLVVFLSAQHGKDAFEGQGPHSPFAQAWLRHLAEPGVKLLDLMERVARDVSQETNGAQQPEIMTVSLGSPTDLYLNPREPAGAVWRKIKAQRDPETLRKFIADYPDAPEAETAAVVLEALGARPRSPGGAKP